MCDEHELEAAVDKRIYDDLMEQAAYWGERYYELADIYHQFYDKIDTILRQEKQ